MKRSGSTLPLEIVDCFKGHMPVWHGLAATIGSLRYWLFVTAGVISHPQGRTTIRLAVPTCEGDWWRRLWEKLLSPFPNCNAVENRPPIT